MFPIVRGSSRTTIGSARGPASSASTSTSGRRAIATTPVRGACGTSSARTSARDRGRPAGERALEVGRELPRQLLELGGVRGHDLVDLGTEPERVLQRVEPLEHGQVGIAARGSIPGDQRSLAAHLPLAAIDSGDAQPGPPLLGVEATPARSPPGTFRGR